MVLSTGASRLEEAGKAPQRPTSRVKSQVFLPSYATVAEHNGAQST